MFGILIDYTGINSVIFMLLYGATAVSLVWMYFTFAKERKIKHAEKARTEALKEYAKTHDKPDDIIAAQAILEQIDLIKEFNRKYNEFKQAHTK
jgi:NNP family nitrate/nitrite transporter-like MFS transporter